MKKRVPDTRNDRIKNFVDKKYLDDIMNVVNTLMRRVTCWKIQREMQLLEASYWKICEDYLGVPLIQAGDSVIIERAVHRKQIGAYAWRTRQLQLCRKIYVQAGWNHGMNLRPCHILRYMAGTFLFTRIYKTGNGYRVRLIQKG